MPRSMPAWIGPVVSHRAAELLNKAHNDIAREEDNAAAQGLQQRALEHIDKAYRHVEEAIQIIR